VELEDITIDVVRKKIKNMHLSVHPPTGHVRIVSPLYVSDDAIRLFAESKLGWIRRHLRNFDNHVREAPREYMEGEIHYFLGLSYRLRIRETQGAGYVHLQDTSYIVLYVKPGASCDYKRALLNEWYRARLKEVIPVFIEQWEKRLNVTVNDWGVKQMKTKWGSCNITSKRIWLNLELAKRAVGCLEYIIVHELVHLLERHHNVRFYSLMDHHLPNWRQLREELNRRPGVHADDPENLKK